MSKVTDEIKLRNHIVKYSVGTLFKIYTHKGTGFDNETVIRKEMLNMAKSRNYISGTATDLSLVPPPLVHDLLVKSIDKLKKSGGITMPPA